MVRCKRRLIVRLICDGKNPREGISNNVFLPTNALKICSHLRNLTVLTRGPGRVSAMDSGGERSMIREDCKNFTLQVMPEMMNGLLDCQQLSIESAVIQRSCLQCLTEKGQRTPSTL